MTNALFSELHASGLIRGWDHKSVWHDRKTYDLSLDYWQTGCSRAKLLIDLLPRMKYVCNCSHFKCIAHLSFHLTCLWIHYLSVCLCGWAHWKVNRMRSSKVAIFVRIQASTEVLALKDISLCSRCYFTRESSTLIIAVFHRNSFHIARCSAPNGQGRR